MSTPTPQADRDLSRVFCQILNRRQHLGKRWVAVLDLERAAASCSSEVV